MIKVAFEKKIAKTKDDLKKQANITKVMLFGAGKRHNLS